MAGTIVETSALSGVGATGAVTFTSTLTISDNLAVDGGARGGSTDAGGYTGNGCSGGAIWSQGLVPFNLSVIARCFAGAGIPGPSGSLGGDGGGIWSEGPVNVDASEITGCRAQQGRAGGTSSALWSASPVTMNTTTVSGYLVRFSGNDNSVFTQSTKPSSIHFCALGGSGRGGTIVAGRIDAANNWWGHQQ